VLLVGGVIGLALEHVGVGLGALVLGGVSLGAFFWVMAPPGLTPESGPGPRDPADNEFLFASWLIRRRDRFVAADCRSQHRSAPGAGLLWMA
jgi:hypothetical protein